MFVKRENRKDLFGKKGYKGRGYLVIREKVGGFLGKKPFSFSLPTLENIGGGPARRRQRPWAGGLGPGAALG